MSFLKSLELSGFKSFAKRTVLNFEPGVTGVVGPNGSGKSNIADAIRWVLGEQSKKAVRGQASTDMIFSGTAQKAPMSLAEVSLTFDNSAGRLPYDYEEVVVTRRLYRSGDSEYLINGAKVRLADLQHAFAVAGIGAENYTVIGQGLVDRVLLQSPAQRRGLFEEAAGIRQFQLKRDDARRKLTETQTNLGRVEDIVRELEPRLKTLRRQAAGLAQREELEGNLKEAYLAKYGHRFRELSGLLNDRRARQSELDTEFSKIETELGEINKQLAEMRERQQGLKLHALLEERNTIRDRRETATAEIATATTQLEVAKHSLERAQRQQAEIATRLTDLQGHAPQMALTADAGVAKRLADAQAELDVVNKAYTALQADLSSTKQGPDVAGIRHAFDELATAIEEGASDVKAKLEQLRTKLGTLDDSHETSLLEQTNALLERRDAAQQTLNAVKVEQARQQEAARLHQESLQRHDRELASLRAQQESLTKEEAQAEQTVTAKTESIAALNEERATSQPELDRLEAAIAVEQQSSLGDLEAINAAETKRQEKQRTLEEYRRALGDGNVEIAKLETRLEDLVAEAKSKVGTFPPAADAELPSAELGDDGKIEKLERRLMELGGIDPDVSEEFTAVEERFEFLSTQAEDLRIAKSDLEKLINKLEIQSQSVFKESFEKIGAEFTQYFTKLFGGGTAELVLIQDKADEEDVAPAEFGIDIKAQPPGKRVQSLAMLSGGERALTSVALLFAILTVNPSPFVMLDEVDAALDEANTSRFADLLGTLAHQTQFIVVTHNRDTMRAAEMLYGVTMDETGVSTLLSIRLPEAEQILA